MKTRPESAHSNTNEPNIINTFKRTYIYLYKTIWRARVHSVTNINNNIVVCFLKYRRRRWQCCCFFSSHNAHECRAYKRETTQRGFTSAKSGYVLCVYIISYYGCLHVFGPFKAALTISYSLILAAPHCIHVKHEYEYNSSCTVVLLESFCRLHSLTRARYAIANRRRLRRFSDQTTPSQWWRRRRHCWWWWWATETNQRTSERTTDRMCPHTNTIEYAYECVLFIRRSLHNIYIYIIISYIHKRIVHVASDDWKRDYHIYTKYMYT